MSLILTQKTFTYSKSTKETVEKSVKYIQNSGATRGDLGAPAPPLPPIILSLQGGPVFSGKICFTNSVYSLSTIII